jgi:hypothetical protein
MSMVDRSRFSLRPGRREVRGQSAGHEAAVRDRTSMAVGTDVVGSEDVVELVGAVDVVDQSKRKCGRIKLG